MDKVEWVGWFLAFSVICFHLSLLGIPLCIAVGYMINRKEEGKTSQVLGSPAGLGASIAFLVASLAFFYIHYLHLVRVVSFL